MSETIGEKLRLAREARGIALRDISEQTRISIRYLEAIETDDYQRLPGGIFNRSFIRAYAKFIGYDEHNALEDYARTLRERGESDDDGSKTHHSLVYTDDGGTQSRSPLMTLILAILILAALSLAVWAGLEFYKRRTGQRTRPPGTGRSANYQRAIAANLIDRSDMIRISEPVKEVEHDFTV
ncbi:MAG TPA: helix-turn-helix domain-containing protein [Pyrinomonadaceae bacterium]|nr:helix-turn-helix domain-containing protein [Pyrinomonadaceae bacterium]